MTLSVRDRMTLELADTTYRHLGRKVSDARELLGYSEPLFWARVSWLLRNPEAEAAMPDVVHRLRRLEDARKAARSARRLRSA